MIFKKSSEISFFFDNPSELEKSCWKYFWDQSMLELYKSKKKIVSHKRSLKFFPKILVFQKNLKIEFHTITLNDNCSCFIFGFLSLSLFLATLHNQSTDSTIRFEFYNICELY